MLGRSRPKPFDDISKIFKEILRKTDLMMNKIKIRGTSSLSKLK